MATYNRVFVSTATTGTGSLTPGSAISNAFLSFANAVAGSAIPASATSPIEYELNEGLNFEIGEGFWDGTVLTRATVWISSIGGTVGTTKLNLGSYGGGQTIQIVLPSQNMAVLRDTNIFIAPQTFNAAITYGGVTLSNSVTGNGSMALSASPTFTGSASFYSGSTGAALPLYLGRVSTEALFAISNSTGGFATNAVAGDLVIRGQNVIFTDQATGGNGVKVTGGALNVPSTTSSTSTTTGALTVGGGLGVAGAINAAQMIIVGGVSNGNLQVSYNSSTNAAVTIGSSNSSSAGELLNFFGVAGTSIGSIRFVSGQTGVSFNTSSDERGKPNRERLSLDYARSIIDDLEIYDFDKDGNAIRGIGVLAQQAYGVHKSLATPGVGDAWWMAEKAGPVPFLVANVQQINARLDAIEQLLAA